MGVAVDGGAAEHEPFMVAALEQAARALELGEVPIGAVLVLDGKVLGSGFNQPIGSRDPTAHAEIVALREASRRLGNYRLVGATLYATLEPCLMCVGALLSARVERVVYGAEEPKFGALRSLLDASALRTTHRLKVVSGVRQEACRRLVQEFFRAKRQEMDPT